MTGDDDLAELVASAAGGDASAWSALVDRFASLVFAVCRGFALSPTDAADVSQTVWLRLAENLDRIHRPDRIGAWLVTTAKRECLALVTARARFEPIGDDRRTSSAPGPDDEVVRHEQLGELATAFALLSERCRQLLRRVVIDRTESYREISEAMAMPIGAIGPTRSRCLTQLRAHLEGVRRAPR